MRLNLVLLVAHGKQIIMTEANMQRVLAMLAALALALGTAGPGFAQDGQTDAQGREPALRLPEMVVIESPIIENNMVDRFGALTTVVGQEQIERLGAVDISSALRKTPGVTITRYNQVGSFGGAEGGAVFVRGMGSTRPGSEIKTYIDGVPMYMGPWSHPLLDLLPVDMASAIEVVKGPQPQTVGNTFSAINIVPRQHTDEGFSTTVSAAGGSFGTVAQSLSHAGRVGDFDYQLGESFRYSNGHRDNADGRLTSGFANMGLRLNDTWTARLLALAMDNYADDPGPDTPGGVSEGRYETRARMAALTLCNQTDGAHGEIKFFANGGEGVWSDNVPGGVKKNRNEFWYFGMHAKEIVEFAQGGELLLGLDQEWWDSIVSYDYFNGTENTLNTPQFALTMPYLAVSRALGERDGWHATPSIGARGYLHNQFENRLAPFAGLVIGHDDTDLRVNVARGVNYPGLDVAIVFPASKWKQLDPEDVMHYEVGLSHRFGDLAVVDLAVYQDKGNNRYSFVLPPFPPTWTNTEDFDIRGMEASVRVNPLPELSLFAGLTVQRVTPDDMPYAPETSVSGGFNWRFLEKFTLSADCEYVDGMYALRQARKVGDQNTSRVGSHFLVNSRLGWEFELAQWDARGELFLLVQNLTDEEYAYRPDYPMPGINGMLGAKLTF